MQAPAFFTEKMAITFVSLISLCAYLFAGCSVWKAFKLYLLHCYTSTIHLVPFVVHRWAVHMFQRIHITHRFHAPHIVRQFHISFLNTDLQHLR